MTAQETGRIGLAPAERRGSFRQSIVSIYFSGAPETACHVVEDHLQFVSLQHMRHTKPWGGECGGER